jgi:hypothetical protein
MSTSVAYLRKRLKAIGRDDLVAGADAGHFSFHAAAIDAGLIKQPAILGNGSQSAANRTAYALWKTTRQSPPLNEAPSAPPMPDLAAALAEWEEAQRGDVKPEPELKPEPAPTPTAPDPTRVIHPAIPCTGCTHPDASAAVYEIFNTYLAAHRGEPQTGNVLPPSCCKRKLCVVDVRALIG